MTDDPLRGGPTTAAAVAADTFAYGGLDPRTFETIPVDEEWLLELARTVDGRLDEIVAG